MDGARKPIHSFIAVTRSQELKHAGNTVAYIFQSLTRREIITANNFAKQETIYETRSKTLLNNRWDAHHYL